MGRHNSNSNDKKKRHAKEKRDSGRASYRFVDRTRVRVSGGMGGNGSLSMERIGRKHKRRPDGGHGGNGGSIVIVADEHEQTLRWTKPHVTADSGSHGGSVNKNGRNGRNTVLKVPCGVVIRRVLDYDEEWDAATKTVIKLEPEVDVAGDIKFKGAPTGPVEYFMVEEEEGNEAAIDDNNNNNKLKPPKLNFDEDTEDDALDESETHTPFTPWGDREKVVIADLDTHGSYAAIAKEEEVGLVPLNGPLPEMEDIAVHAKPQEGETAFLELELKLIADIGLVGFPNAGKSSLLAATSRATPHIAPYPFTTLNPLVGYVEYSDGSRLCVADVPGLIQGASEGRGRGHDFLRHLERTKALLFIVDAAGMDGRGPVSDLEILIDELQAYGDGDMLNRRALVVANKMDLLKEQDREVVMDGLMSVVVESGIQMEGDIIGISAGVTGEGLGALTNSMRKVVQLSETDSSEEMDSLG
ncbi:MAG: hypothetical protein SGBAC_002285 [Bacillariaceae sp.]